MCIRDRLLDFLFSAGDFSLYVFLFLGFFGEVFQTERVLPQRGIKLFLYHIGQGVQQLFFKDKRTRTNTLFDAVVADTVIDIYLRCLSADAFLPMKAMTTVGAEDQMCIRDSLLSSAFCLSILPVPFADCSPDRRY